ncbi:MAG: ABC transporter substrate-binding protein [Sporichthyaceae bacterium]
MKTRQIAVVLALLVTVGLAACAGDDEDPTTAGPDAQSASPATSSSPTVSGSRTVSHDKGQTVVPANPARVVVLDTSLLDATVFLGLTPVGAVRTAVDSELPSYLGDRADDIEIVGTIGNPNLEAIAALRPDLIISATLRDDERYDTLGGIAPTVFTAGPGTTWRTDFQIVADALGKSEQAQSALADFDARAQQIGEAIGAAGTTASIVRFLPDETRVYGPDSFSGSVLRSVGLGAPELDYDEFAIAYLSSEQIEMADADIIFATTFGPEQDSTRGAITGLWGNLRAIENGCQFDVDDDAWMLGIGLIGAQAILADVERLLADGDCAGQ